MSFTVWVLAGGLFFIFISEAPVFAIKKKLIYCRVDDYPSEWLDFKCPVLVESPTTDLICVTESDRAACMRHLLNRETDFTIAQPEDLLVFAMNQGTDDDLRVTHELREAPNLGLLARFQWVVVIRIGVERWWNKRKTRFCSPNAETYLYTQFYSKYFVNKILSPNCDPRYTMIENRFSSLSEFFESACISTEWTHDYDFDKKFKEKYSNLCKQCVKSTNCTNGKVFKNKDNVVNCLFEEENSADFGWTTLFEVRSNFLFSEKMDEFYFLCPDGKTQNLASEPCIWLEEPRRTIIARKEAIEALSTFLTEQTINAHGDFYKTLQKDAGEVHTVVEEVIPILSRETPSDYLNTEFSDYSVLKDNEECEFERRIIWCVVSDIEFEKCKWISYAAHVYGAEPLIQCVIETNQENCINSIINGTTDILVVKLEENLQIRKKGLKPVVHMVSSRNHGEEIAAIVRKVSNYKSLTDLKNSTACFAGYRDPGWNSFIYMMGKITGNKEWFTNDTKMVSEFFHEACVVGIDDRNHTFPRNLHTFCASFHGAVEPDPETKTMDCLYIEGGDVAFVNLTTSMNLLPNARDKTYTKPLCLNGSAETDEMDKCFTTWQTLGSIMVHENITEVREDEIHLFLMDLDKFFGEHYHGQTPLTSLYKPFNGTHDVIFPSATQHLERKVCPVFCSFKYENIIDELTSFRNGSNFLKQELCIVIMMPFIYLLKFLF